MSWIKLIILIVVVLIGYAYLPDNLKQGINDNVVNPIMEKTNIIEEINITKDINSSSDNINLNKVELGKIKTEAIIDCRFDEECRELYKIEKAFCEGGICYVFT